MEKNEVMPFIGNLMIIFGHLIKFICTLLRLPVVTSALVS